jgi:KaiC/GvpD/RAD55 family RecA-like ATPase
MEYVRTGIRSFDHLFANNGYPKNNSVLVIGGPGSGKSIFGMQYIYNGAAEHDEPGVYVTLEENPDKIRRNMKGFGWDIEALEEQGKISMVDAVSYRVSDDIDTEVLEKGLDVENMISNLEGLIREKGVKRLVIDSLAVMGMYAKSDFEKRTKLIRLSNFLSMLDVTSVIITEAKTSEIGISKFPAETFMFDGVIILRFDTDSQDRKIAIRKMRGTKHVLGSFNFNIDEEGISIRA